MRPYGWLFDADLGGGWLRSIGSHMIDFVRWSFGDVVDASAQLRTAISERPDADGKLHRCTADDGFTAVLRSATGVTSLIDSTFAAPVNLRQSMLVIGTESVLEVVGDQQIIRHTDAGQREEFTFELGGDPFLLMREYAAVVRDTVHAGHAGPDTPTFADGLACVEVLDRLRG